jgi:tetratricopeptide (TPR) repeat protein
VATETPDPALRLAAENALEDLIQVMGPVEQLAPDIWAGEAWAEATRLSELGDQALADRQWRKAAESYQQALQIVKTLQEKIPTVPEQLLGPARKAYANGEQLEAVSLLQAVLLIDPENAEAADLLPRAQQAEQSYLLLTTAQEHVEAGELDLAYASLVRLEEQDRQFPGASELKSEVEGLLTEGELQTLIGRALTALEAGDLETAQRAIQDAAGLAPGHPAVEDAQSQIEARVLEQRILSLRQKAEDLKQQENWKAAHETWLEIEALDPDAPWVLSGLTESLRWAVIDQKITRGLTNPGGTQTGKWVEEFQDREGWPSGLSDRADRLEAEWKAWTTPVRVVLVSDGETEITIPRKGRWRDVVRKEIELLPGSHVAKGGRLGYRDVRVEFQVPPGSEQIEVEVICVEGI